MNSQFSKEEVKYIASCIYQPFANTNKNNLEIASYPNQNGYH
jgi:hypothetical protein